VPYIIGLLDVTLMQLTNYNYIVVGLYRLLSCAIQTEGYINRSISDQYFKLSRAVYRPDFFIWVELRSKSISTYHSSWSNGGIFSFSLKILISTVNVLYCSFIE